MPVIAHPHPVLAAKSADGQHVLVDILADVNAGYVIDADHLLVNSKVPASVVTKLLPEAATQAKIVPRLVIQHTNGGEHSASIDDLFGFRGGPKINIEAHLQVQKDGVIGQFIPFNVEADANTDANRFVIGGKTFGAISHETQDAGFANVPIDRDPWSMEQLAAIIGATTAECIVYNIRCTPPAVWNDTGIAHHSLFPFLGNDAHGNHKLGTWTLVAGKVCPGAARIKQMDFLRQSVANRMGAFYQRSREPLPLSKDSTVRPHQSIPGRRGA